MKAVRIRVSILGSLLALTVFTVSAQELVLNEIGAVDRALEQNLSLQARRITLSAEERDAENAWNTLLPSLSVGGSLSRRNEEITTAPPADPYHVSAGFSLSAQLTVPAGSLNEIEATHLRAVANRRSYEEAEENIAEQVRKLFFSLILMQEQLTVNRSSVATAEENYRQTQRGYDNGRYDSRTLKQAELQLEQARLDLARNESTVEDSMATFKNLLGIDDRQEIRFIGELPEDVSELDIPRFEADKRRDLSRYDAQIGAQEASINAISRGRWLPTISVSGSYAPSTADPFNPDNEELYGEWNDTGILSLNIAFALDGMLPFSRTGSAETRAEAQLAALRVEKQHASENARREYNSLRRRVNRTLSAIESTRLNLELAREVEGLTREAYESGTTDFLSLVEAQTDVEQARLALLQEAYNLKSTLIELEYAAGGGSNLRSGK